MRVFLWVLKLFLFLVVLAFAVKNIEPIRLDFYFGLGWQAPLVIILFVFFFIGVVFGLLAFMPVWIRLRRENTRLRREVNRKPSDALSVSFSDDEST